jgi:hypothetical protein
MARSEARLRAPRDGDLYYGGEHPLSRVAEWTQAVVCKHESKTARKPRRFFYQ